MHITSLKLTAFRNYASYETMFNELTTILVGQNAIGKTNILEAIYLLASGESFKAQRIDEMVKWGEAVSHVAAHISTNTDLLVTLTRGEYMGRKVHKRGFRVNGVARRKIDFVGNMHAVLFRPEDLELITGSPSFRRRFLDGILVQVDREYRRSLASYEKGLTRRNRLLDLIREGNVERRALSFWDHLLIKEGSFITNKRRQALDFFNSLHIFPTQLTLVYEPSIISEQRLTQYEREEVAAGHTLVGPHKDDFVIKDENRNLAVYGSRGEQRMAVLWMKMAELQYIEESAGERPILLLDDIFSELDAEHDAMVMAMVGKQQTIITTTDRNGKFKGKEMEIVELGT